MDDLQDRPVFPRAQPGVGPCQLPPGEGWGTPEQKQDWPECPGRLGGREAPRPHRLPCGHPQPPPPQCAVGVTCTQTAAPGSPAQADVTVEA